VQACIYISQGYCMPTTIARSVWRYQRVNRRTDNTNGQIKMDNRTQQSTKQYIHIKLKWVCKVPVIEVQSL
jgi:hypothetical protein